VWPGASVLLPVGVALFGIDVRFDLVTSETYVVSPVVFGTAGFRF
jgi:hypothetical protein